MITERIEAPPPRPVHERRIAVLPFVVAGAVLTAAVVGAVAIASLAATPPERDPLAELVPPPSATAMPEAADPPAAEPDPLPPAGPNQCFDEAGDAVADLVAVQLDADRGGSVLARFEFAGTLPSGTTSIWLLAEGDRRAYRFVAQWRDGDVVQFSAYEADDDRRDRLDRGAVSVHASSVLMRLPSKHVGRLGDSWGWSAFTGVDGILDDSCGEGLVAFDRGARSSG